MVSRLSIAAHRGLLFVAALVMLSASSRADDPPTSTELDTAGRPVYLSAGQVVVFPKGVEEPPKNYRGSIGVSPLALISIDDKTIGEVFSAKLTKSPEEEAKGMVKSADRSDKIELLDQSAFEFKEKRIVVVTLQFNLPSKVGNPWILHSLYFPQKSGSSTFKLAVGEDNFKNALPYLETMLGLPITKHDSK